MRGTRWKGKNRGAGKPKREKGTNIVPVTIITFKVTEKGKTEKKKPQ